MKRFLLNSRFTILTLLASVMLSLDAMAQSTTNAVPVLPVPISLDFLTNVPSTTNFTTASVGAATGTLIKNGGAANYIKLGTYIHTNWTVSAEIQNAPVSTIIDNLSLYGGYRKTWANAEVYTDVGGRRNWITANGTQPSWQGVLCIGASWIPLTGGKASLNTELEFTTSSKGDIFAKPPGFAIKVGPKLLF